MQPETAMKRDNRGCRTPRVRASRDRRDRARQFCRCRATCFVDQQLSHDPGQGATDSRVTTVARRDATPPYKGVALSHAHPGRTHPSRKKAYGSKNALFNNRSALCLIGYIVLVP
jgi:hypothetical protein